MAAMAQMQNALRAEIRDLKVKIVSLETAEADNSRLRKELSSIQTKFEDEKEKQEFDFLNRLADITRENNARVADLEANLEEQKNQKTRHGTIETMEHEHRGIAQIVDRNRDEVDVLQNQLRVVQTKRDELTRKLEEAYGELELKDRKLESLGVDASLDSTNPSSDRMFSSEYLSLQQKLREANEEIARLKTGKSEQTSIALNGDGLQQRKVEKFERENLRLQGALKNAEQDRKKHDITVLQLERRNHDLKMCLQKMEIQVQNEDTETRASYGFTDDGDLEVECQRLQTELQKTKNALNMANLKQEELGYELRKASTANVECSPEVDMLQQRNQSLHLACEKLGGEVDELNKQLLKSGEQNRSLMEEIMDVKNLLQSSEQDKKKLGEQLAQSEIQMRQQQDSGVNMIRDMEQSLKREKVNADNTTAKFSKQAGPLYAPGTDEDATHATLAKLREENRKLNLDVNQLQVKLDGERKLSRSLRTEIGEPRTSDCSESRLLLPGDRASFSSPSPSNAGTANRKAKPNGNSSTRGSVKGIAARFENGGFQTHSEEKVACRTSFSKKDTDRPASRTNPNLSKKPTEPSDEVKILKRDLEIERKQVVELEEELTRQCEINGSLLKEINELSLEIEAKRIESANHFKISLQSKKDQKEIGELTSHLTKLSQELNTISKEKADLDLRHQVSKKKIFSLQEQVNEKTNDFSRNHSRDQETILHLEVKVKSLEKDLAKTLTLVEDLRDKLNYCEEYNSNEKHVDVQNLKIALDEKENKISQMEREKEQIVLSMKDMTGLRKQEIEELQIELARLKSKNAEQVRETELGSYNLQSVENSNDNATTNLQSENIDLRRKLIEATSERQTAEAKLKQYLNDRGGSSKSVQILRERNAALKFEVEKLTKQLSKLNGDTVQVTRVMI